MLYTVLAAVAWWLIVSVGTVLIAGKEFYKLAIIMAPNQTFNRYMLRDTVIIDGVVVWDTTKWYNRVLYLFVAPFLMERWDAALQILRNELEYEKIVAKEED